MISYANHEMVYVFRDVFKKNKDKLDCLLEEFR